MVLLVTTDRILSALEAIPPSCRKDLELPDSLALDAPISHDQIIKLSRYFRENPGGNTNGDRSLDSLLRGVRVYVPPPPPKPEPSPEYLAQKARLLAAMEADTYNRMTSSLPLGPSPSAAFATSMPTLAALHDSKQTSPDAANSPDPLTPSLVLNIFLSVLITGFSVYWMLTSFHTSDSLVSGIASIWQRSPSSSSSSAYRAGTSEPVRVLLSLFAALGVGAAEVLIYAIYLGKIEQARSREKKVKERKEIVESDEVGGHQPAITTATATGLPMNEDARNPVKNEDKTKEGEIIWGRGVNGGLRRRVREKWEEEEKKKSQDGASVS